jgi:hypothetical protein
VNDGVFMVIDPRARDVPRSRVVVSRISPP